MGMDEASSPRTDYVDPVQVTSWPSLVSSQLPPLAAAKSTMTEPGRMRLTMAVLTSTGARRPGPLQS